VHDVHGAMQFPQRIDILLRQAGIRTGRTGLRALGQSLDRVGDQATI
jgi:hypothetical protein